MFEQDSIMRLVKEIIRVLLKLLFNLDVEVPTSDLFPRAMSQVPCLHEHLANAARVKYPAALLRIKLDTPSACCGVFDWKIRKKRGSWMPCWIWLMPEILMRLKIRYMGLLPTAIQNILKLLYCFIPIKTKRVMIF